MANGLLAVMMIPKEKHRQGEETKTEGRESQEIEKKGDKLLRQSEKGKGGVWGVWHIDRPGCVHLTPEDKI